MEHATAPLTLSGRFGRALAYATEVHAGQLRKGAHIPYAAHLLAVASLVMEHGGDEDVVIAALLHDAAEDHGGEARLTDIRVRFGDQVSHICRGCSDALPAAGEPKEEWRPRKERYLHHLEEEADSGTLLVSAADKLHNTRAILLDYREVGETVFDRFRASRDDTLWYYRRCVAVLDDRLKSPLTRELARTVSRLDRAIATRAER